MYDYFKFGLAVLLLLCLLSMPYGYYMLVRFIATIVFVCMAVKYWQEKRTLLGIIAGSLALLFQPFMKVTLGRGLWNTIDVIVAIALIIECIMSSNQKD